MKVRLEREDFSERSLFRIVAMPMAVTIGSFLVAMMIGIFVFEEREKEAQKQWISSVLEGHQRLFASEIYIYQEAALVKRLEKVLLDFSDRYDQLDVCLNLVVVQAPGRTPVNFTRCAGKTDITELRMRGNLKLRLGENPLGEITYHYATASFLSSIPSYVYWLFLGSLLFGLFISRILVRQVYQQMITPMLRRILEQERLSAVQDIALKVSHDIRAPVFALKSALSHARELDPDLKEIFQNSCRRIVSIADSLRKSGANLRRSSPEPKKHRLTEELRRIIPHISEEMRIQKPDLKISLTGLDRLDLQSPWELCVSECDCDQLERCLSNIINNADEAGAKALTIQVDRYFGKLSVRVEDDGSGFSPRALHEMRSRAYSTKADGNGLGLLQARQLMARLGGLIEIQSKLEEGSQISLIFRLQKNIRLETLEHSKSA